VQGSVTFRITFSEAVSNVDATDLSIIASGTLAGYSIGPITPASGTTIDVTINGITGNGTLTLNVNSGASISDAASNALAGGFTTGQQYTFDRSAPTVLSLNRKTPADALTNAASVVYTITFSEAVSGVSTNDFTLVLPASGLSGSVSEVSAASGTAIDVTVSSITVMGC
jgi:hypothetical protein